MQQFTSQESPFSAKRTGLVNIILHGLFCMEYKQLRDHVILEITAPDIEDHHFVGGTRGNLILLDGEEVNWTSVGLLGSRPKPPRSGSTVPGDVPITVPQFSRSRTGVGSVRPDCSKGRLVLPWPTQFFSKRFGPFPPFESRIHPGQNSVVGDNIKDFCHAEKNSSLGVVTGMVYQHAWPFPYLPDWIPTLNFHFFFQPFHIHTGFEDVNRDLALASKVFQNEDNFDLRIAAVDSSTINPVGTGNSALGTANEDELAIGEPILTPNLDAQTVNKLVVELGLLDLLLISEEPSVPVPVKLPERRRTPQKAETRALVAGQGTHNEFDLNMVLISNANCPSFFVG